MSVTQEQVSAAIASVIDPYLGIDLVAADAINSISIEGNSARVEIELGFPVTRYAAELENTLRSQIAKLDENVEVEFDIPRQSRGSHRSTWCQKTYRGA